MTETDGVGLATVLTTDADLQIRFGFPPPLYSNAHQFAHTVAVDDLKRVVVKNVFFGIQRQEEKPNVEVKSSL